METDQIAPYVAVVQAGVSAATVRRFQDFLCADPPYWSMEVKLRNEDFKLWGEVMRVLRVDPRDYSSISFSFLREVAVEVKIWTMILDAGEASARLVKDHIASIQQPQESWRLAVRELLSVLDRASDTYAMARWDLWMNNLASLSILYGQADEQQTAEQVDGEATPTPQVEDSSDQEINNVCTR